MNRLLLSPKASTLGPREKYPTISELVAVTITLPLSTAEVERIFSQLKLIKTDHRNRLNINTLNKLLMVKLNLKLLETDCVVKVAAQKWLAHKNRQFVKYL